MEKPPFFPLDQISAYDGQTVTSESTGTCPGPIVVSSIRDISFGRLARQFTPFA
jgi:hypothetical protein